MADPTDNDETEVNPELESSSGQAAEPDSQDFTEYETTGVTSATGFDTARNLARKAQSESGRLLKKRFVLEDVLGRGGMGVVYKARDLRKVEAEDSNPHIAVKVLGQNFKDHPHAFVSLQQEAVKSQKLAHPNIVTVHDFDREGSTIFMTMELLKGDPLDSLLKLEAPFSKETALRYFSELCSGLDYAHKRGLIHSDFKPANIFVTTSGIVKILDFGIARAANKDSLSSDFDAGDLGALTPAYATVEMVNGESPSFSDDVYALACVLYQMLTGNHPYERLSAADALAKKLKPKRVEVLTNKEWQALNQALSLSKAKRPASIEEFRANFIPEKRSQVVKIVAAVSLAVIAGGGWLGTQQYKKENENQALIDNKLQAAKECFYQQSYQCAIENARIVTSLVPGNSEAQELLKGAQQAQQKFEQQARIGRLLQESRDCLGEADYGCAKVKAREVLSVASGNAQALQLLEKIESQSRRDNVDAYLARANNCLDKGDVDCANEILDEAKIAGVEPAELYQARKRADDVARSLQDEARELEAVIQTKIDAAWVCYRRNDFSCASGKAEEVLALDASNAGAIEMQQSVKLAKAQQRNNQKTVAKFLGEAEDCYQKRNYSCAIAKSESALAILPDSADAMAMKKRAVNSQNKAKKSISIE